MSTADVQLAGRVLLVLGMHRSGTSLLSGLLAQAGMDPGRSIMDAAEDNPTGYWENTRIVHLHEQFLNTLGHTWSSSAPLPEGWRESDEAVQCRRQLAALIEEEFDQPGKICVKDPRLCRLLPMWQDLCMEQGFSLRCTSIVRPAGEVVASLEKRDSLGYCHGRALWLRYNLEMGEYTRDLPCWRTSYDTLLAKPDSSLKALSTTLDIELETVDTDLVDPELKHHSSELPADSCTSLYRVLAEGSDTPPAYLAREVMPLALELADLEARLTHASVNAGSLSDEQLASARERVLFEQAQDAKRYAGSMEQELEKRQAYALNLEQEVATRDTDIEKKMQFIQSLKSHIDSLEAELEKRETFVKALQGELEVNKERLAQLEHRFRHLIRLDRALKGHD